jgi:ABC-type amino acid transport substrate-binding protein
MRKLIPVALFILIGTLVALLYHKPFAVHSSDKSKKNELHFGTCADYPPMEYYRDGILTGFEIELAKSIAQKLGKKITFEDMAFSSLQIALEKGFLDAFVAAFGVRPEGRERFDFSVPYYTEGFVFLHKKSDPIAGLKELSAKKIIYQLSNQIKKGLEENLPKAELVSTDRIDVAVEMFKAGHGDCVYMDIFVADAYCEKNPDWAYFIPNFLKMSDGTAIVLPKGSPWRIKINEALKAMEADGELQALRKEWKLETAWKLPNE